MFIETENTPNPEVLTFRPHIDGGGLILPDRLEFKNKQEAEAASPLASRLFTITGVRQVFFGHDFISVMKEQAESWQSLKPLVIGGIIDHFARGDKILHQGQTVATNRVIMHDPADAETVEKIQEIIESRIRPAVARDGGDIILEGFDKGVVYLLMRGACSGCPSSTATLKAGIENMLKHFIPAVKEVRQSL
ncbi:MAG: NifU family protein [Alphaproteobacteria bacterium]|nr:NifU family protein [Alphaproteobacteria bacterium]